MARINYYGTDEVVRKLDDLGENVEDIVFNALLESAEKPKEEMLNFIKNHKRTGITEGSFKETLKKEDGKIYLEIGFDIKRGGLPALFLNYGTPRQEPYFFIDKAIENNLDEIKKTQEEAMQRALAKAKLK